MLLLLLLLLSQPRCTLLGWQLARRQIQMTEVDGIEKSPTHGWNEQSEWRTRLYGNRVRFT